MPDRARKSGPQLRDLERRGLWNWVATSLLLVGLCGCLVVLLVAQDAVFQLPAVETGHPVVVGLCGLVALFCLYALLKQRHLERLRSQLFESTIRETELTRARESALEVTRLKTEFLSQIGRDIRTPMTGILGAIEILLESDLAPRQVHLLRASRECVESLTAQLNDLLDLAKIDPQRLELEKIPFNLRECVATAIRPLVLRAQRKGLDLECHVAAGVPDQLAGDPGRLRQLITILVGNGIKFTERGEVVIRIEPESEMDRNVILRFSISDTGIGIPAEARQAIFTRDAQGRAQAGTPTPSAAAPAGTSTESSAVTPAGATAEGGGSADAASAATTRKPEAPGLGLALASQLLTMMGGHIGVESEPGKGSTFWFTARFTLRTHPSLDRARVPMVDLKDRRVLLVGEHPTGLWIFTEMLSGWGVHTATATGTVDALRELKEARLSGRPFDLVLLDLSVPGAVGMAPAARIKADPEVKDTPLIVLTSAARKGDARHCREVGIAGYLPKPVMAADLLGAMRTLLGSGGPEDARALVTRHWLRENRSQADILLVQSDPGLRDELKLLLEKRGHRVVTAEGSDAALQAIHAGAFDVVVIDAEMPEAGRFDMAAIVRAHEHTTGRHLPVVALAPGDRERPADLWAGAGIEAWVGKPVDAEALLDTIDRVVTALDLPDSDSRAAA